MKYEKMIHVRNCRSDDFYRNIYETHNVRNEEQDEGGGNSGIRIYKQV
jgi:hypothetical protein